MAPNSTSSANGFVRNSTAPAFIAWTVFGTSPQPVMKMIGMSGRSTATCFCRSRPLRPGREMSSTRQLGTRARGRARNSSADANVCGSQPSQLISNSNDSRTDRSSSTTNTIGTACDIRDNPKLWPNACAPIILYLQQQTARGNPSVHLKRRVESLQQSSIAEWLEQARHRALCQNSRADSFIPIRSDEDDRNVPPTKFQFPLEFRSGHARHADVEDQAVGQADVFGGKELFRRRERTCAETEFPQQVG